jgi:hypothetical protein
MQHILFSVISAIIGINILVVSAQQEGNKIPEFEHYTVESVYDIDATPYIYKEVSTIKPEPEIEISIEPNIEPQISKEPKPSESIAPESPTQTITNTPTATSSPVQTVSPTPTEGIISGQPTATPTPTISTVLLEATPTSCASNPPYPGHPAVCL